MAAALSERLLRSARRWSAVDCEGFSVTERCELQVCDDEWHSYSLLFNGVDDVNLMVDGQAFKADERNPEILDDWPLHQTKAVVSSSLRLY